MKRSLLVLLLVLLLALLCSCKHKHDYAGGYSSDDLYHWRSCECGDKSDMSQHDWNTGTVTVKPTVDSDGERVLTCTVCRAQKTEKIDKLGPNHTHTYDTKGSDENYHWNECICGEKDAEIAHSWDKGEVTKYPTLEAEGEKTFFCTECGYKKVEKIEKIDPDHEHKYDTERNDEYSHWIECICGARDSEVAHSWNDGEITTPAGETLPGIITYTCTECGHKATENIPASNADGMSFLQSTHYKISGTLKETPLTLEAEIYVPTSNSGRVGAIFGNYIGIRQDWLLEIYNNGVPRFYYVDASGNIRDYRFDQVDVRTGDWVHIGFTFDYDNKVMTLYLDGEVKQCITIEGDLALDTTRYEFILGGDGRSDNSNYFQGKIRSLAAYSDVRSADEIARSHEKGTNLYADDLILSYHLDKSNEGNGVTDLTGNGNDIPKEWLDSHNTDMDYAYSFAVVGDTQWLSKYVPEKMEGIYTWLLDHKEEKKIAHVFGLGDITEDWNTATKELEWIRAQQYISMLDGEIPYTLVRGNHDESKYFLKYFATDAYMSQFDGCGGFIADGDIRNSYKLMTIGSTDYLFMTLDFGASDEMLAWANEVVLAYPERRVIVTTHGYHGFDGNHLSLDNTPSSGNIHSGSDVDTSVGNNFRGYNNGEQIWEKFISKHPNIFLVMSGHTPFEDIILLQSEGNHGNIVNQMVIDAQWMDPQKGGVGMVCMLYFSEDGSDMAVEWICTDTGKYYKEQNQFTLDLTNSINTPAHDFKNSYDEKTHHMACECGYTYNEEPHTFDGGTLTADGLMEYSCACGYKRITSATNDPVALELQAILDRYYNNGVYYKDSGDPIFYNGDKYVVDGTICDISADQLTLRDFVLGKFGDLRLDLGWNCYDGVYSSSNASALQGMKMLVGISDDLSRVTVEENGSTLVIGLWSNDTLVCETTIGYYATTTLVALGGDVIDVIYTKAGNDYMCTVITPAIGGYVAEYDKIILDVRHSELTTTVYYSTVAVWDGVSVSTSLKGSGNLEDPYLVESGADLAYIAQVVNSAAAKSPNFSGKYFKMTQSIDLNGNDLNVGAYTGWGTRKGFYGYFDGNHCTVRGLNQAGSLFGTIEGGWLKNLSVYGSVSGGSYEATGGIVGYTANGGLLENLTSYVTVTGTSTLGGIVGNAENQASDVINCVNYGSVTGTSYIIGGIAGSGGHNITGCVNFGNVTSTANDCVGGIAGSTKNTGAITNCYNYGNITARGKAAGIAGQANKPISDCINYGNVNGTWALGGVVGLIDKDDTVTITNCENYGSITASSTGIGGILGIYYEATKATGTVTIKNCVNGGAVSGTWGVGGIAGDTIGEVIGCVNNGYISAKGDLGGIVGKCYGKVTECINNGKVVGAQDIIGGIVGRLHDATHLTTINTTNTQQGSVSGPGAQDIIGKIDDAIKVTVNENIIGINHRGWHEAPENTLSAYRESKDQGFKYVECDVQFTKDGIPVLLHDDTIDRTSNGSGTLSQMTYAELLQYDFSYDDKKTIDLSAYRGEKIPTFEQFIALCKELGLHPYIEIKGSITNEQAAQLVNIVAAADMLDNVSWLSFSGDALAKIVSLDKTARIVWVITDVDASKLAATHVPFAKEYLMSGNNEVVFDLWYSLAKQDVVDLLKENGIRLEVWTVNDVNTILGLNPYVSGVSSDKYDASQVAASIK